MVACHLLKWVDFQRDTDGQLLELRFFRDVDGREVDFVIVEGRTPVMMVECKLRDEALAAPLRYLVERFPSVPAYQVSAFGSKDVQVSRHVRLLPARKFPSQLV